MAQPISLGLVVNITEDAQQALMNMQNELETAVLTKDKSIDCMYKMICALFALTVVTFLLLGVLAIFYSDDIRGVESNVIHSLQLTSINPSWLYQDPAQTPYNITQYSPLYYALCSLIVDYMGIESSDHYKIRVVARLVSTLIFVITMTLMFRFLKKRWGLSTSEGLIICSALSIFVFPWYFLSRPDVLVAFSLITSVTCYLKLLEEQKFANVFFLSFWVAIGLIAKLNALALIIIFSLAFLAKRQHKLLIQFILSTTLVCFIGLIMLHIIGYDMSYLKQNIVDGVRNQTSLYAAILKPYRNFLGYFSSFTIITLLALLVFRHEISKNKLAKEVQTLFFICVLMGLISAALALKKGSAINYFNEFLLVLMLMFSIILSTLSKASRKSFLVIAMIFSFQIASLHFFSYFRIVSDSFKISSQVNLTPNHQNDIVTYLRNNLGDGTFISQDKKISMAIPKHAILFPSDIIRLTFNQGVYDYSSLDQEVISGKIKYVVKSDDTKTVFSISLDDNFTRISNIGKYKIYINNHYSQ